MQIGQPSGLHSSYSTTVLRRWQAANSKISSDYLVFPVFVSEDRNTFEDLPSLTGQKKVGLDHLGDFLGPLVKKGLAAVLLFGVVETGMKDCSGSIADSDNGIVIPAVKHLKKLFPQLTVICDVCLCAYTDHGHCGILKTDGKIDLVGSVNRLAAVALSYARAGADMVAPSDMMDGRVRAIKKALFEAGLHGSVAVMSYSAKFASAFYGPFRDAANSSPAFGDRKCYQLPPGSRGLAIRAAIRDASEGADIIMVKPGTPYLDILSELRHQLPHHPLAVYHVSGEYAMLMHAAAAGSLDLKQAALELMTSFRRAGASIVITYLTPYLLDLNLNEQFS